MLELTEELQERVDLIKHKLKFIEQRPTVACIEKLEPGLLAGAIFAELVDIAGGINIVGAVFEQDPDIIIVMPQGYPIVRSMNEISMLLQLPGFADLKAVKNNRLYIADGDQYFNNSHLVDSIEILAEIINPKQFIFGYEGEGWIKFEF
jgi:iron complex transport system substrate-binding protein